MRTFSEASAPPVHEEQTHRAWLLGRVVWTTAGTATVFLGLVLLTHPELAVRATTALVTVNLGCLVAFALNRRGHSRLASVLLVGCLVALVTGLAFSAGGIRSPGAGMYLVFVLMAGMLLGHRAGVATALVCASLGLFLVILEATGRLPRQTTHYDAVTFWLLHCLYMGVVLGLLRLTTNTIETALRRAEHLVVDLGKRVKELRALHAASRLLQRDHHFERAVLEELVRLLPPAFQHPDCCEARVAYGELDVRTEGFRDAPWRLVAPFRTSGGDGSIEVVYVAERRTADEGPFLAEERALLTSVSEMLVAYLDHDLAQARRRTLESQLRQAQKMEALGTLAGGVAHDFNNILTSIGFNVELLRREVPAEGPSGATLDDLEKAHTRAKDLVKQILLFSRRQKTDRKPMLLEPVIREALGLLRASLPPTIQIDTSFAADLPPISCDASQIHQILMNLGTNAGHAMADGGGVLSVETSRVTIPDRIVDSPSGLPPGDYVCTRCGTPERAWAPRSSSTCSSRSSPRRATPERASACPSCTGSCATTTGPSRSTARSATARPSGSCSPPRPRRRRPAPPTPRHLPGVAASASWSSTTRRRSCWPFGASSSGSATAARASPTPPRPCRRSGRTRGPSTP